GSRFLQGVERAKRASPRSKKGGSEAICESGCQVTRMQLFGSSGIRGVANEEVTPTLCLRIGLAVGTLVDGQAAVGRDTRATGEMLADATASGLASAGSDVDRLGALPTPALQSYA